MRRSFWGRLITLVAVFLAVVRVGLWLVPIPLSIPSHLYQNRLPAGVKIGFEDCHLSWRYWDRPLEVVVRNCRVVYAANPSSQKEVVLDDVGLTVSLPRLLQGKLAVGSVFIRGVKLVESTKSTATASPVPFVLPTTKDLKRLVHAVHDIPTFDLHVKSGSSSSFYWEGLLRKRHDRILAEVRSNKSQVASCLMLDKVNPELRGNLSLGASFLAQTDLLESADAYWPHLRDSQLEGAFKLVWNGKGPNGQAILSLQNTKGGLQGKIEASLQDKRLQLQRSWVQLGDLRAGINATMDCKHAFPYGVSLVFKKIPLPSLKQLWPIDMAEGGRLWVQDHVKTLDMGGRIFVKGQAGPGAQGTDIQGDFDFKGWDFQAIEGLPDFKNLKGRFLFDAKKLQFHVNAGNFSQQTITKGDVVIDGFSDDKERIKIDISLNGSAKDMVGMLSKKPFDYAKRFSVSLDHLEADLKSRAQLSFPLLKNLAFDDVGFNFDVVGSNTQFSERFLQQPWEMTQGGFRLTVVPEKICLKGDGIVQREKLSFSLEEPLAQNAAGSTVSFETRMTPALLEKLSLKSLVPMLPQPFPVVVTYQEGQACPWSFKADLIDVPCELPMYKKPKGQALKISGDIDFANQCIRNFSVDVPSLFIKGNLFWDKTGGLKSIKTKVWDRRSGCLNLSYSRLGKDISMNVKGSSFQGFSADSFQSFLKSVMSDDGGDGMLQDGGKLSIHVAIQKLTLEKTAPLHHVETTFKALQNKKDLQIKECFVRFYGNEKCSKDAFFLLRRMGDDWRAEGQNLGYFLKGLGLFDDLNKGAMTCDIGAPQKSGVRTGRLLIQDFTLAKTSLVQRFFMTILSPTSFPQLFSGKKLPFTQLKLIFKMDQGILDMERGEASSLDTSFVWDGWLDYQKDTVNVKGNVIPLSFLNKIIRGVPVVGAVVAGGKDDGLFSTRFYVKGKLSDPSVMTNPVQILAPGILKTPIDQVEKKQIAESRRKTDPPAQPSVRAVGKAKFTKKKGVALKNRIKGQ